MTYLLLSDGNSLIKKFIAVLKILSESKIKKDDIMLQNPLPDTAVTGVISTYGKREIFLQAFRTIQGTSCVPIFWVIRDDEQHSDAQLTDMVTAICNLHQVIETESRFLGWEK